MPAAASQPVRSVAEESESEVPAKPVTFRFPVDLIASLKELARRNDRTVTAELIRAIRSHLANSDT